MTFSALIISHLPVLQVIIPLLGAPVCALLPSSRAAWVWATIATWSAFLVSATLIATVYYDGTQIYQLGNWPAPFGIEYRIDLLNAFVLAVLGFVSSVVILYAKDSVAKEIPNRKHPAFYAVYLLCLAGLFGILSTNDVFNIYVFLEISSLATYTLIAMGKDRRALAAAFKYLVLGTLGATFILIGIGLLYMMTGTLNLTDLSHRIAPLSESRPILAAFAFITVGVCMKMALFPLHMWLPNAYTHSPSFVSAFLSTTATKVSVYVLIRFIYSLFEHEFAFGAMPLETLLSFFAVLGIFIGSGVAIYQPNVKKMLAYSSVAQMGYIALGIGLASETGLTASLIHIANHAFAKGTLFMAAGAVAYRLGQAKIYDFQGLGTRMPLTMLAFALAGASMVGVPLTAGFISKWYLLSAAIEKGWWPLVIILLISSLMALVYIGRVIEAAYFGKTSEADKTRVKEAPLSMLIPIWVLAAANIFFGINTELTVGIAEQTSEMLILGTVAQP